MEFVVDTSVLISVVTNEATKRNLVQLTQGARLVAPESVHWEVGNAFSAMLKRQRITIEVAQRAVQAYQQIPLRLLKIDLIETLQVASKLDLYAYDANVLVCAQKRQVPLLTLDRGLRYAARSVGLSVPEVT